MVYPSNIRIRIYVHSGKHYHPDLNISVCASESERDSVGVLFVYIYLLFFACLYEGNHSDQFEKTFLCENILCVVANGIHTVLGHSEPFQLDD